MVTLTIKLLKEIAPSLKWVLPEICEGVGIKYNTIFQKMKRGSELTENESTLLNQAIIVYCNKHIKETKRILNKLSK